MNSVGIIGFGRFGKVLSSILQKGFSVKAYDGGYVSTIASVKMVDLDEILREEVIFIAVPIRRFEEVITEITPKLGDNQTVIDVCSVKSHPVEVMTRILPGSVGIIATHPLFGPDSGKQGIAGLKIALCPVRIEPAVYASICDCLKSFGLILVETSPQQHDQQIARSQAIFHLIAQTIKELQWRGQEVSTPGPEEFYCLLETVQHDTDQLFFDMEQDNPHAADCREKFIYTMTEIHKGLAVSSRKLSGPES